MNERFFTDEQISRFYRRWMREDSSGPETIRENNLDEGKLSPLRQTRPEDDGKKLKGIDLGSKDVDFRGRLTRPTKRYRR